MPVYIKVRGKTLPLNCMHYNCFSKK